MVSLESLSWPARLGAVLQACGLVACSARSAPEWPELLREVRERYPGVTHVTVDELRAIEADPGPLLLDARAPEEYGQSHLQGALAAPDEATALAELGGVDPAREIVVYCSVGMRSSALAERLQARGFTRVRNLEGGIFQWANAGLPTVRATADGREEPESRVHPYDARWGTLLAPERRAPTEER